MSINFAYRSHYEGPACKSSKRFDDATLLDWFRHHWRGIADREAAYRHADKLLGASVYGFGSLFHNIAEHSLAPPRTETELVGLLTEHTCVGKVIHKPHLLQVLTDDDEIQLAYYFFDDQYLARHLDRAAYLLREDWRLPGGYAQGTFKPAVATQASMTPPRSGPGTTYLVRESSYDSGNLEHLTGPPEVFAGVRLPDLACHLVRATPDDNWPFELVLFRSQLLRTPAKATRQEIAFLQALHEQPDDDASWMAYSDWLQEQGRPPAGRLVLERALRASARYPVGLLTTTSLRTEFGRGSLECARAGLEKLVGQFERRHINHNPRKSRVRVGDHVAQLGLHTDRWWGRRDVFHHWVFFDDLWAAAHPDLAHSLLRYHQRWDVLS